MIAFNISRITLSNKEKEQVLNKWKDKLGIPNTELSFQGHLIPFLEENGMFKSAQTEWDNENNKTMVINPYNCVVGCSSCSGLCKENAIIFPPLTILKNMKK